MKREKMFQRVLASILSLALVLTGISLQGFMPVQAAEAEDGLLVYYDFVSQNDQAAQIPDASGNNNIAEIEAVSGSARGKYTIVDANIYGRNVKALDLKGGDDGAFLILPEGILSKSESVTVSAWVKLTTDNGYQRIWDFGSGTQKNFYLCSDNYNKGLEGYSVIIKNDGVEGIEDRGEIGIGKGKNEDDSVKNIDKNRWVLTTVVMDGSKMSLYENGVLVGEKETGIKVKDLGATNQNYIAYSQYGDTPTTGQFAEFKIYNKALTAQQIKAMYNVTDAGIVSADDADLDLGDLSNVTEDFDLPAKGVNGSSLAWTSQNSAIAIENGTAKVTRPAKGAENATGTITAAISFGEAGPVNKTFDVTVMAEYTDQQIVEHDKEAAAKAVGDISTIIDKTLVLPAKGEWGSAITWTWEGKAGGKGKLEIPSQADEDGNVTAKVTRPPIGSESEQGKLKATVASGTVNQELVFDVTLLAYSNSIEIKSVENVNITTLVGRSPTMPKFVKVTFSDNSTNKMQVRWPNDIEEENYKTAGTFTVEGTLVGEFEKVTATVTVKDEEEVVKTVLSDNFDLNDISLDKIGTEGSILTQNQERDIVYLKLLDNKRMLYNFYKTFGETAEIENVKPLGGWDEPGGLLRGHSTGHYMSALALAYASTGDDEIKSKLDNMVTELHKLQQKSKGNPADFETAGVKVDTWSTDPNEWGEGFISAYSPDQFALLEIYTPYGSPDSGIWAPYYTLHKLLAGLLDAYTYTGNEEALTAAKALGKWAYNRLKDLPQEQLTKMWGMYIAGELGGMNESMAQLYIYAKEGNDPDADLFLKGAKLFDNTVFFDNLAKNVDDIRNRHANQHIPQVIGALKIFEATVAKGEPNMYYYNVAQNFWDMTVSRYAYSIGGVGVGEAFPKDPYTQAANIMGDRNCETCAAYNMLKMTKMLNNYDPDNAEYMDYYERTLYNQILASQTPNVTSKMHNGTTYMLPIGPGARRDFGGDYDAFTCCHGTGMENHVKYQEAAYAKTENDLYVGLYLPSTLTWKEKGVKVVQETEFPSESTKITVVSASDGQEVPGQKAEGKEAGTFNMKLRVPYWATKGFEITVNGTKKEVSAEISTYVTLENIKAGDVIEITMPWGIHLDKTPDTLEDSTVASFMYGPFVMASRNSSTEWQNLTVPENLENYMKVSTNEKNGFPILTGAGLEFVPMFAPELASEPYHAYSKVAVIPDDGSEWYQLKVDNRTPLNGSISTNAKGIMMKEGTDLVVTLKPNDGYAVRKLIVNGQDVKDQVENNVYTLENVSADVQLMVTFRPPADDPMNLEYSATIASDRANDQDNWYGEKEDVQRDWEPQASDGQGKKGWVNWYTAPGAECKLWYTWDDPVTMNAFDVYWRANNAWMKVPGSLEISYLDADGNWQKAVMHTSYENSVKMNQYNRITFDEITTTAVRLDMTINTSDANEAAGCTGVYRWKVMKLEDTPPVTDPADKEALTASIENAEDVMEGRKESDYTGDYASVWTTLTEKLAAANDVKELETATQDAVDAAKNELDAAVEAFVNTTLDMKLEAGKAAKSGKDEKDYPAAAWKELTDAIAEAEALKENEEATQKQKLDACDRIDAAISSFKPIGKELAEELKNQAVAAMEGKNKNDYDAAVWEALESAIKAYNDLPENASDEDILRAYRLLEEALKNFVPKGEQPNVPVASVTLNKTSLTLTEGGSETLTATVAPADASNKAVNWTSSNPNVASVENGKVTAKTAGTAVITVASIADSTKKATCNVTVNAKPGSNGPTQETKVSGVTLNVKKLTMGVKEKYTLKATVKPAGVKNKKVTWKSDNTKVLTVKNGKLTAKKAGKAKITVTSAADKTKKKTITVTVKKAPDKKAKVTLNKKKVTLKLKGKSKTFQIKPKVSSKYGSASFKYTIDKKGKKAVKVDANGKVTAKKKGKATITVKTYNGKAKAVLKVTVK